MDGQTLLTMTGLVRQALSAAGIGPEDRVAVVLPNGPLMATAFLTLAASCCVAPLNPSYLANEYEFALADLTPAALILATDDHGPARAVAERLRITVLTLESIGDVAGQFRLDMIAMPTRGPTFSREPQSTDPALVLHTSGTTARPKLVVLSNVNLLASARNIAATLALEPTDRCLNVMPLFHVHGLIGAVLSSLVADAAVCCTPGFNAFKFGGWLDEVRPTWYTAVPTMHQAILVRMREKKEQARGAHLRFIRSSSAALPPQVMAELEALFEAPVIEAYGMTEAAHQITSNLLPPKLRKAGTVGVASGAEVGVLGERGDLLPESIVGEVVIRGANVTAGYDRDPEANAKSFTSGWFRTGDLGWLDKGGVLTLAGRLKEQINRGGEKISPVEIDIVLLDHPAVAEVCTFAVPHATLGEEVGVVVVPRAGHQVTNSEIRTFAAARMAHFKVPRCIVIADEIPKGATGKVQRIGLAAKLGFLA